MKLHLPWCDRNPAEWVEDDIGTEGGLYGWDHTDPPYPIPSARIMAWAARRNRLAEPARLDFG